MIYLPEEGKSAPSFGRGELFGYMRKILLEISSSADTDDYLFLRPAILVKTSHTGDGVTRQKDLAYEIAAIRDRPPGMFQSSIR